MNIIVAVDKNWAIGKDNKLLVSIPSDMKFSGRDNRESGCHGKKDIRKFSGRTAVEEADEYCADF